MAGREKKSNIVKLNSSPASPLYETFILDDTQSHPPLFDSVYLRNKANVGRPTISRRHHQANSINTFSTAQQTAKSADYCANKISISLIILNSMASATELGEFRGHITVLIYL